jgi:hypothetical protein
VVLHILLIVQFGQLVHFRGRLSHRLGLFRTDVGLGSGDLHRLSVCFVGLYEARLARYLVHPRALSKPIGGLGLFYSGVGRLQLLGTALGEGGPVLFAETLDPQLLVGVVDCVGGWLCAEVVKGGDFVVVLKGEVRMARRG